MVNGESGAGKTETAKRLLEIIAASSAAKASGTDEGGLHTRLIEANPILESLGCAKMSANDNSSRFGKFISVIFDEKGVVSSALVNTYLLEKSRVIHQGPGECNFHIFYEMLSGSS